MPNPHPTMGAAWHVGVALLMIAAPSFATTIIIIREPYDLGRHSVITVGADSQRTIVPDSGGVEYHEPVACKIKNFDGIFFVMSGEATEEILAAGKRVALTTGSMKDKAFAFYEAMKSASKESIDAAFFGEEGGTLVVVSVPYDPEKPMDPQICPGDCSQTSEFTVILGHSWKFDPLRMSDPRTMLGESSEVISRLIRLQSEFDSEVGGEIDLLRITEGHKTNWLYRKAICDEAGNSITPLVLPTPQLLPLELTPQN